jgi:hypothetical protein
VSVIKCHRDPYAYVRNFRIRGAQTSNIINFFYLNEIYNLTSGGRSILAYT